MSQFEVLQGNARQIAMAQTETLPYGRRACGTQPTTSIKRFSTLRDRLPKWRCTACARRPTKNAPKSARVYLPRHRPVARNQDVNALPTPPFHCCPAPHSMARLLVMIETPSVQTDTTQLGALLPSLYRLGIVLDVRTGYPGHPSTPITLGLDRARQAANRIIENQSSYLGAATTFFEHAGTQNFRIKDRGQGVAVRFAPGAIIDFPTFQFELGSTTLEGRFCFTVCLLESQSKVWLRFVSTPNLLDASSATHPTFHKKAKSWATAALRHLADRYVSDLKAIEPAIIDLNIEKSPQFEFFSMDVDRDDLEPLARSVTYGESIDPDKTNLSLADLERFASSVAPEVWQTETAVPRDLGRMLKMRNTFPVAHLGRDGSCGLYIGYLDENRVTLAGIAALPFHMREERRKLLARGRGFPVINQIFGRQGPQSFTRCASLPVTAEMATVFARSF